MITTVDALVDLAYRNLRRTFRMMSIGYGSVQQGTASESEEREI